MVKTGWECVYGPRGQVYRTGGQAGGVVPASVFVGDTYFLISRNRFGTSFKTIGGAKRCVESWAKKFNRIG